jgi:hypothetical protein
MMIAALAAVALFAAAGASNATRRALKSPYTWVALLALAIMGSR